MVQADLNEQQRERLVATMVAHSTQYPVFCVSKASVNDPQLQRRTYYIGEHGTLDGEADYWVTDDTSGGKKDFVALCNEEHFLVLSEK